MRSHPFFAPARRAVVITLAAATVLLAAGTTNAAPAAPSINVNSAGNLEVITPLAEHKFSNSTTKTLYRLLGSATSAMADVTPQVRQEFDCPSVRETGGTTPAGWGVHCTFNDRFVVPPGQYLCVAVRGSTGIPITFRAFNVATGNWVGRASEPLVVGAPRDCVWQNRGTRNVTVEWKAWKSGPSRVNVYATGYVQSTGS